MQRLLGIGGALGTAHGGIAPRPGFRAGQSRFRPGAVFGTVSAVAVSGDARPGATDVSACCAASSRIFPTTSAKKSRTLLVVEQEIVDRFRAIVGRKIDGARIRCHGDYHLGQVLFTGKDFVIIDFEGEPSRRISERRIKRCPLRDVAGMIRSFDYASQSVLLNQLSGIVQKEELPTFQHWAKFWSLWTSIRVPAKRTCKTVGDAAIIPQSRDEVQLLLDVFLLEKAVYELAYELNNRPSWMRVPVQGILRTLELRE